MKHLALKMVCVICSIILMMPQGWCCFLTPLNCCQSSLSCCAEEKQKKPKNAESNCCCCDTSCEDSNTTPSPQPLRLKCPKCIHDVPQPKPSLCLEVDLPFLYVLTYEPAAMEAAWFPYTIAHLSDDGPPLHLQLCIWRC